MICSIPQCGRAAPYANPRLCQTHYKRRLYGRVPDNVPVRILGDKVSRFWSYVPSLSDDVCWEWTGNRRKKPDNYGAISWDGVLQPAHRVSWTLNRGEIPPGMIVRHTCDNPPCVNPAHLALGTDADNTRDKVTRGRMRCHLKPQAAIEIRALFSLGGVSRRELAALYGVSYATVNDIIAKRRWGHVTAASTGRGAQTD